MKRLKMLHSFKYQPQNNKNQVNKLVECLLRKTKSHYEEFCHILDVTNQGYIKDYLKSGKTAYI